MWTCPKCGTEIHPSSEMCKNCGTMRPRTHESQTTESFHAPEQPERVDGLPQIDASVSVSHAHPPLDWAAIEQAVELPVEATLVEEESTIRADTVNDAASPGSSFPFSIGSRPRPRAGSRVEFRVFRGTWSTWQDLFQQAAHFSGTLGPERLISISHSEDRGDGVVTVWYWE